MIFQSKYDLDDNRAVIRRLHRGDMACFEACYKFYYRGLCSFASRWVPVSTAEDIVQDAMLYIWENRDKLLEELSLKGLLFMIVRNKAFDRIAHRQVRQRVHQQLSERSELSRLYDEALARLPEQTRRIFEMSRRMGMTHQQIAAELGVSPQTVNYHISQALRTLGVALKDYLPLLLWLLSLSGRNDLV